MLWILLCDMAFNFLLMPGIVGIVSVDYFQGHCFFRLPFESWLSVSLKTVNIKPSRAVKDGRTYLEMSLASHTVDCDPQPILTSSWNFLASTSPGFAG